MLMFGFTEFLYLLASYSFTNFFFSLYEAKEWKKNPSNFKVFGIH